MSNSGYYVSSSAVAPIPGIENEPCRCEPDECEAHCPTPTKCVNRLAYAVVRHCPKCVAGTWHVGRRCLRCTVSDQDSRNEPQPTVL